MITTTLNRIREQRPCEDGWRKLLEGLGKTKADDEALPFAQIVKINGIADALWCCRAEPQYAKEWRLFAVWCARQVEYLLRDARSREVLEVAERHAHGEATDEELKAARAAAWEAASAAAGEPARAVAWAASAASAAAGEPAWAAGEAARASAREAASAAAWKAAREPARAAAREAKFLEIVS